LPALGLSCGKTRSICARASLYCLFAQSEWGETIMATILCVLYSEPVDGIRQTVCNAVASQDHKLLRRANRAHPERHSISASELLGSGGWFRRALGLRLFWKRQGHTLVVTSVRTARLVRSSTSLSCPMLVISPPFLAAYLTAERISKRRSLRAARTRASARISVDLQAHRRGITVADVTFCNS